MRFGPSGRAEAVRDWAGRGVLDDGDRSQLVDRAIIGVGDRAGGLRAAGRDRVADRGRAGEQGVGVDLHLSYYFFFSRFFPVSTLFLRKCFILFIHSDACLMWGCMRSGLV